MNELIKQDTWKRVEERGEKNTKILNSRNRARKTETTEGNWKVVCLTRPDFFPGNLVEEKYKN